MATLNIDIPRLYCFLRKEFLYDGTAHYLTNTSVWKVERETETSNGFFYDDVDRAATPSQVRLYAKGLRVEPTQDRKKANE